MIFGAAAAETDGVEEADGVVETLGEAETVGVEMPFEVGAKDGDAYRTSSFTMPSLNRI